MTSVLGNVQLGYVVIETTRFADWRRFGRDAIGMHLDDVAHDALRFRSTTTNAGSCCGTVRPRTSSPSAGSSTTTAPSTKSSRA